MAECNVKDSRSKRLVSAFERFIVVADAMRVTHMEMCMPLG